MQSHSDQRGTHDIPKPDTGLAEWTSRIKAMQRQVDADEEAEQKRLEEEIAASRLARLRRSHAVGDSSKSSDLSMTSPSSFHNNEAGRDSTMPGAGQYIVQPSPSRTLRGNGTHIEGTGPTRIQPSIDAKPSPVSLAAFMGGRAAGPRLNRHAPQQDTHDPTQFHQRGDDHTPHPIFGKGGVAMPGMVGKGIASNGTPADGSSEVVVPGSSVRKAESPLTKQEKLERAVLRAPNVRERTTSTSALPSSSSSQVKPDLEPSRSTADLRAGNHYLGTNLHASTTTTAVKTAERPVTPHREHEDACKPSPKSPIMTPSLARPVHPQPRFSTSGPQIPTSNIPSPAFLRLPPQKDPTPSISRLQGRGFVQSMVKVSKQLESPPTSTSDGDSEHSRQANIRRASVLDRWQPNLSSSSSPPVSPTPKSMHRSGTTDPISGASDRQHAISSSPRKLKLARSSSSLRQTPIDAFPSMDPSSDSAAEDSESSTGLGSATTLLVYKPTLLSSPAVDEFGLKHDSTSKSGTYLAGKLPAPPGKPLSHPTKDRARKPLKSRQQGGHPQKLTSASESPTSIHSIPTAELSESPITSLHPSELLTTAKNATRVRTAISHLEDTATVDSKLTGSATLSAKPLNMIQRALPGTMTAPERANTTARSADDHLQDEPPVANKEAEPPNAVLNGERPSVAMPSCHSRIPSLGNRATIMDVAQVLSVQHTVPESALQSPLPSAANQARNLIPSAVHMERRKSSQERYSAMLPPLKEETTPTASPTGTLSHAMGTVRQQKVGEVFGNSELIKVNNIDDDMLLRNVNIEPLIKPPSLFSTDLKSETISVDVMLVRGTTATTVSQSQAIFYDTELLAIVHRSKSRTTGLVLTTAWAWRGKHCTLGEKENRKLQELAKRYGTSTHIVRQHCEPTQLVHVLGGQLAIRQGMRAHWTPENTTMHLVRLKNGVIFIDEHDISIQYLCSGFSYCLSILGTVYVWYGCGSTPRERQAALGYARSLEVGGTTTVELYEGEGVNDEMIWMILGDEEFANADYWKWRKTTSFVDPRIWRVNTSTNRDVILPVDTLSEENCFRTSVYILDCVWELYIMVGSDARGHRRDIGFALKVAMELSARVASARPYAPTVHVLILPSQLPRDLRLNFRDLDELFINNGNIPDHMNILSSTEALDHLQTTSWDNGALQDQTMLPLGVVP